MGDRIAVRKFIRKTESNIFLEIVDRYIHDMDVEWEIPQEFFIDKSQEIKNHRERLVQIEEYIKDIDNEIRQKFINIINFLTAYLTVSMNKSVTVICRKSTMKLWHHNILLSFGHILLISGLRETIISVEA